MNEALIASGRRWLPASVRHAMTHARTRFDLGRVGLASLILPRSCYVQILPNTVRASADGPQTVRRMKRYSRESALAHRNLVADGVRLLMLSKLLEYVRGLSEGDYAEVGTWRGYTAREILADMADGARLYCFDTFEGFDESDVAVEEKWVNDATKRGVFTNTSEAAAREIILDGRQDADRLVMRKGLFPQTFAGLEDHRWRFVHLDVDLYNPTHDALELFYDRLVPGGVVLLHDYDNAWAGVKKAADAFFEDRGIVPVPLCDKAGSAVIIKHRPARAMSKH